MDSLARWGTTTRIGLVLGAGGLSGEAFHRGVLRGLHEGAGWDARSASTIVGTSAGALVGASLRAPVRESRLAAVPQPAEPDPWLVPPGPGAFEFLAQSLRRPWALRPTALASSLIPAGNRSTDIVQEGIRNRYGDRWAEKQLLVVATRRHDGQRIVFGQPGDPLPELASAVGASCAVPGYFRPVVIDGVSYVDGAMRSPTNADVLSKAALDVVIVSSPMSIAPGAVRLRADLSLRFMWHQRLQRELRVLRRRGVRVLALEPDSDVLARLRLHPMHVRDIDQVEELAREMTLRRLERSRSKLGWAGTKAA